MAVVLLWVWIAVVVVALIILLSAAVPLLGRLGKLRRAMRGLQIRLEAATKLQAKAEELQRRVLEVQESIPAQR